MDYLYLSVKIRSNMCVFIIINILHQYLMPYSLTYPQRVPKIRFIMKKAPINTSVTKYNHGQVGLVVSLI